MFRVGSSARPAVYCKGLRLTGTLCQWSCPWQCSFVISEIQKLLAVTMASACSYMLQRLAACGYRTEQVSQVARKALGRGATEQGQLANFRNKTGMLQETLQSAFIPPFAICSATLIIALHSNCPAYSICRHGPHHQRAALCALPGVCLPR